MNTQVKINRPEARTINYLYSYTRTAQILKVKESDIEFVMLLDNGKVLVGLYNDSKEIDKSRYVELFVNERKERAEREDLTVTQWVNENTKFTVRNQAKGSTYIVNLYHDSLKCDCPDYQISSESFNSTQVACKHIYSVLNVLGLSSLKDYVRYQRDQVVNE